MSIGKEVIDVSAINSWNPDLYDGKLSFVSHYGKGIVELLQPKNGENILDIGCGTGDLFAEIAKSDAIVTGIDASRKMIETARAKYPNISFQMADAENYKTPIKYDAVFSNAALHWMKQAEKIVKTIAFALKPGGRFVSEFAEKEMYKQSYAG